MNCYVCDTEGRATPAVTTCSHCGVGMCRMHFEQDAQQPRPRGMVRSACAHPPVARALRTRGHVPVWEPEPAASR